MTMNRRDLLKKIGIGVVAAALPIEAFAHEAPSIKEGFRATLKSEETLPAVPEPEPFVWSMPASATRALSGTTCVTYMPSYVGDINCSSLLWIQDDRLPKASRVQDTRAWDWNDWCRKDDYTFTEVAREEGTIIASGVMLDDDWTWDDEDFSASRKPS